MFADSVKLVRDTTGEPPDNESKTVTNSYDANARLTTLADTSPGAQVDNYALTYNGINQLTKIDEKLAATIKATTTYSYDENGNPRTRNHNTQNAVFDYDVRDLVNRTSITEPGQAAKVTEFDYTPRGQLKFERKANRNTVDYAYTLDGHEATQVEKKLDATTLVSQHLLDYDANGHKTRDASKTQHADNAASYLDEIHEYAFDPRDRARTVTKKAASNGAVLETEQYRHDANDNVTTQTIENQTTSFTYDRNRLHTSTTGAATAKYNYDPFGRLDTVTTGNQITESYTYGGFDRTTQHRKRDGATLNTTNYTYDPLDRTTTKTDKAGTPGAKTTTFAYLGLSEQVVTEETNGKIDRSYHYDAHGQRLTQQKKDTDGAGPQVAEDSVYGYNPHTDVETLTKENGDTRATYGYTAYGTDDKQAFTGTDKPEPQNPSKDPYNFYRYTAKRFDPASNTYDMGFRDYNPGLNRFQTRDTYNGALNDLNLGTNPFTGNRYTFTSGNPITRIEIDGHTSVDDRRGTCGERTQDCMPAATPEQQAAMEEAAALSEPALGEKPDDATIGTLRDLGYGGSNDYTYLDALNFALSSSVGFKFFCDSVADLGPSDCAAIMMRAYPESVGDPLAIIYGLLDVIDAAASVAALIPPTSGPASGVKLGTSGARTLLDGAAKRTLTRMGPGKGPVHGTKAHTAFKEEVDNLGQPQFFTEVSYKNGQLAGYGEKGSIRADVVFGPDKEHPIAIFDFKTGSADLTPGRISQIQGHLPKGFQGVPVIVIR